MYMTDDHVHDESVGFRLSRLGLCSSPRKYPPAEPGALIWDRSKRPLEVANATSQV
jgi:hypothetical protein